MFRPTERIDGDSYGRFSASGRLEAKVCTTPILNSQTTAPQPSQSPHPNRILRNLLRQQRLVQVLPPLPLLLVLTPQTLGGPSEVRLFPPSSLDLGLFCSVPGHRVGLRVEGFVLLLLGWWCC